MPNYKATESCASGLGSISFEIPVLPGIVVCQRRPVGAAHDVRRDGTADVTAVNGLTE